MPAFVSLLPTCIQSLLVLSECFFFFLNHASLLIEGTNEEMPHFFKSSRFLKQLLKWKDVVSGDDTGSLKLIIYISSCFVASDGPF